MSTDAESEEQEANYFAMCLLMPESMVRKEVTKMGGRIDLCDDRVLMLLSKRFGVTVGLMAIRLSELYHLNP